MTTSKHLFSLSSSPNGITSGTNLNTSDANSSNIEGGYSVDISPGMTEYWIPNCEDGSKPKIGMTFNTLEAAISFYKNYAAKVGFDIRYSSIMKSKDGVILTKYILCSREGYKNATGRSTLNVDEASSSSITKRIRVLNRTCCKARIVFKFIGSLGYVVKKFKERHNHCMSSILANQFLKVNRNIDVGHQKFIANRARANIGPTKSFNLYKEMVEDFSNVGATNVDFKNFNKDFRAYIISADGQMIVNNFFKKKEVCEAFYFAYDIDEDEHLCKLFWADPISRKNFGCFGDVVSFDATYQTKRYNMVFTPLTGIDNHKKSITFAAGLLTKEDIASYIWLFEHFKKAMGAEPKKKLNSIVWSSYLEPLEFENEWKSIMEEFDFVNNNWLEQMFELRRFWIPAYFRYVPMASLLRTTSRSEGENDVFSIFTTPLSSLFQFYMQFERALDSQRHNHAKHTSDNEGNITEMKTPLPIEKHASTIKDGSDRKFTVEHNVTEKKVVCSCKMFERIGLLCSHTFVVFKDFNFDKIPMKYVLNQWTKDASLKPIFHIHGLTFNQGAGMDERKVLLAQLWSDMPCCIGLAEEAKMDKLNEFAQEIKQQKLILMTEQADLSPTHRKNAVIESYCESSKPSEISILPPRKAKNKGSGKRMKGKKELAMDASKKGLRKCHTCDAYLENDKRHDSRNHPLRK
ncbi:protein FAR1-RELATED SEQUENCE 5-like [Ipomoea triloba]|uniref:protein FAR1-RELATED SEQUENCE 5-like n=1 Tax=Ipomoea triloba TaxID=35885 RepID=UPI00125E3B7D|nr:protein FAR1-RELATED SEQUENCE 5-like [Ipomoea triloba]